MCPVEVRAANTQHALPWALKSPSAQSALPRTGCSLCPGHFPSQHDWDSGLCLQLCPEAWFSEDSTGSWEGPSILQVWTFLNKRTWIFSLPGCVVVLPGITSSGCHGVDTTSYLYLIGLGTGSQHRPSTQPAGSRDGGDQDKLGSPVMSPCVHYVGLTSRQLFILTKHSTPQQVQDELC